MYVFPFRSAHIADVSLQRVSQIKRLSPALFLLIARFLAVDTALGSLAALNLADREVRAITLPVLYETVIIDQDIKDSHLTRLQKWTVLNSGKRRHTK